MATVLCREFEHRARGDTRNKGGVSELAGGPTKVLVRKIHRIVRRGYLIMSYPRCHSCHTKVSSVRDRCMHACPPRRLVIFNETLNLTQSAFIRQCACAYMRTLGVRDDKRDGQGCICAHAGCVGKQASQKKKKKKKKPCVFSASTRPDSGKSSFKVIEPVTRKGRKAAVQKEIWNPQARKNK